MADENMISTIFGKTMDETSKEEMWHYLEMSYKRIDKLERTISKLKMAKISEPKPPKKWWKFWE